MIRYPGRRERWKFKVAAASSRGKGKEPEARRRYQCSELPIISILRRPSLICMLNLVLPGKCSFCVNPPSGMPSRSVAALFSHAAQL